MLSDAPLLVTGMWCSGTSIMAQTLARAGLFLGDNLRGPGASDPQGNFEDLDVVAFHRSLFRANDAREDEHRSLRNLFIPAGYVDRARAFMQEKYGGHPAWGWKDPRTSLFLDFWFELFPAARGIVVVRNPVEVAASLTARGAGTSAWAPMRLLRQMPQGLRLWMAYNEKLASFVEKNPRRFLVLMVPHDINKNVQRFVHHVLHEVWHVDLGEVDFGRTYVEGMMEQRIPAPMSRILIACHPVSRLMRRLKGIRERQVELYAGGANREAFAPPGTEPESKPERAICIVTPRTMGYSQTFVRNHIRELPFEVMVVRGGPHCTTFWSRVVDVLLRIGLRSPPTGWRNLAFRNQLRGHGIEAVMAEFGPTGTRVMRSCAAVGVPLVVHFHGHDAYNREAVVRYQEAYRELFGRAAAIVAVSRDMVEQLRGMGAPAEKIHYNPCGADCEIFDGAQPESAPPVFLSVGRFVEKKAPDITLRAFAMVLRQCSDARLIMMGDGALQEGCKQLARSLEVTHAVHFTGPRSHLEVAEAMRTARAFVQHSIRSSSGDCEGTPVSIMEAGASGLPVVSTLHGGIKDVVVNGETGSLVAEGDMHGMGEAMTRLALSPVEAARMGQNAYSRVRTQFSLEKTIARLGAIIESVILQGKS